MSATEHVQSESRSSVKITRNARGDHQVELKLYAPSDDYLALEEMEAKAVEIYDRLCIKYAIQSGAK